MVLLLMWRFNMNGCRIFVFVAKNICHNVSKCCWLHPQQNEKVGNEKSIKLDKGKQQEKVQKQPI